MIVYIDKGKTYCVDERGTTSNDLGILLFNYYDEHKRDRDLQEVIEHVILREGSLTYNYLEFSYNYNVDNKYSLQKFQMGSFLYNDNKKIYVAYDVSSEQKLIFLELVTIIRNNCKISKCKRCGRYFIAKNNHNANYCDRVDKTLGATCSKLGSAEAYKEKLTKNPILLEYQKAYKRLYARVRNGNMEQAEFDNWIRDITIERDVLAEEFEQTQDLKIVLEFKERLGNKK